ncbi:hypothetical protein [Serratia inhibens]
MKKRGKPIIYIAVLVSISLASFLWWKFLPKSLNINQCSLIINEENKNLKINAKYQRVISVIKNKGFARETGRIYEGEQYWNLNRFYSFSVEPLSNNRFIIKVLSGSKSDDDDIPALVMKNFRPEQSRAVYVTQIEEVSSGVWLFSGLTFPLFACKEYQHK